MDLVEDEVRHVGPRPRVRDERLQQVAGGDEADARVLRVTVELSAAAHAIANRLPDALPEQRRDAVGERARGQAAGLRHDDVHVLTARRRVAVHLQRDHAALAAARLPLDAHHVVALHRAEDLRHVLEDGEGRLALRLERRRGRPHNVRRELLAHLVDAVGADDDAAGDSSRRVAVVHQVRELVSVQHADPRAGAGSSAAAAPAERRRGRRAERPKAVGADSRRSVLVVRRLSGSLRRSGRSN